MSDAANVPVGNTHPVATVGNPNPPAPRDDDEQDLNDLVPPHVRERILEDVRRTDLMRGIITETINILYREYGVRGLKYFRLRVEKAETVDELKIAADMLTTLGRFHEVAGREEQERT